MLALWLGLVVLLMVLLLVLMVLLPQKCWPLALCLQRRGLQVPLAVVLLLLLLLLLGVEVVLHVV